ncbi:MAG: DUF1800 family protein [Planctomycetota bacterium]
MRASEDDGTEHGTEEMTEDVTDRAQTRERTTSRPSGTTTSPLLPLIVALCLFSMPVSAGDDLRGSGSAPAPTFSTASTVLWLGESALLPLLVEQPREAAWSLAPVASRGIVVVEEARFLAGETIGYVRVRATALGPATLQVGDAQLQIDVREPAARVKPWSPLRVVSPGPGAALWGKVRFAVQFTRFAGSDAEPTSMPRLRMHVPGLGELTPIGSTPAEWGPLHLAAFEVDCSQLTAGYHTFVVRCEHDGGAQHRATAQFLVLPADAAVALSGECEDYVTTSRPQAQGERGPRVQPDGSASGARMVANYGPRPAWVLPVDVSEAAAYQLFLTVRGDYAGGAFPTIAMIVDDQPQSHSATRIAGRGWHRMAIGTPIQLAAGSHHLTAYFANDFFAARLADRNLYLDRFELVPVSQRPPGPASVERVPLHAEVRVAFRNTFDGSQVLDELPVEALCWWRDAESTPPPTVTLWVNGAPLRSQRAAAPAFWIARSELYPGANEVRLTATLDSGVENSSLVQTVHVSGAHERSGVPRRSARFSVYDSGWDDVLQKLLRTDSQGAGHRVAAYYGSATATLELPEDLVGDFDCSVEARGDAFEGAPICKVELLADGKRQLVGQPPIYGQWQRYSVGALECRSGEKKLLVTFANDHYQANVGDRNLYLRAVVLRQRSTQSREPADITIDWCYPKPGASGYDTDVAVVKVPPGGPVTWGDVEIDGQRQRLRQRPTSDGFIVLPLLLRDVAAGKRRLRVVVGGSDGVLAKSDVHRFRVLRKQPKELTQYERAVRMLDRFGFGVEEARLAELLAAGEQEWLAAALDFAAAPADEAVLAALATVRYPRLGRRDDVRRRVALEWLRSKSPARIRFAYWLENHFNTWLGKTDAGPKWSEHRRFADLLGAPFSEQLLASASSPAMLTYLDQQSSFRGRLNENYAREIMELHTLGVHGGYRQEDVTTAAKLLTGWTYAAEAALVEDVGYLAAEFRFDPRLGDGAEYRLLGSAFAAANGAGRYARVRRFLELLTRHPSTAKFLSTKLVEHYVAVPAPAAVVAAATATFQQSGGDLSAVLRAIARHPDFWRRELPPRVATPLDYGLRLTRICGDQRVGTLNGFLNRSGMALYDRATPDGYPDEDHAYADSNAMLQRWRLARQQEWRLLALVPPAWVRVGEAKRDAAWRQRVVDYLAMRVTGRLLGKRSNEAACGFLRSVQSEGARKQILEVAKLICQLPEANLR